jgi:tetratricopeptide (TPR) repeat protein
MIRQELPHETYIEMAIQYYDWNMAEEALRMLELAPAHPMVQIWQAYILDRTGKKGEAANKLDMAMAASPELVFPFRPSMIKLFSWANEQKPNWKWRYYEALIYWQTNQAAMAKALFNSCGTEPDFAPFYLAKAQLFRTDPVVVKASVERAYQIDPASWRTGLEMSRLYTRQKELDKALLVAGKNYKSHPDNCVIGLQYSNVLMLNGKYTETLSTLSHIQMLPAESDKWSGEIDCHTLFRETNILIALNQMKAGKWAKAVKYLKDAETWPDNLGSGEPYFADNRITQFFAAYCFEKLKDKSQSDKSFNYLKTYKNPDEQASPLGNQLTGMAVKGERNFKTITEELINSKSKNRDIEILRMFLPIL